ncbi:hypothetical protein GGF46_003344 [Coemansia sp. RSA 552]|nr:hypothetical protein GGF46_003344 [Coemansia sp. RSA 552]
MFPEDASHAIEHIRVRRLLQKLLDKIADLEEAVPRPSPCPSPGAEPGRRQRPAPRPQTSSLGGDSRIPPAHPFGSALLQQPRRRPRYTYKRRRYPTAEISGESDCGGKSDADGAATLSRSPSSGSLSDGQDPARWLTTPRKRPRRRQSATITMAHSINAGSMETRSRSFASRLETLIVPTGPAPANRFKAMYLHSYLVSLGESLWLVGAADSPGSTARVLPLKTMSAFRLGEAIALSDGAVDMDYLDEMYSSLPPFLVRFVAWQHAVSLCYLRIPAYADTLSEALWHVGAFAQQQWLIEQRLASLHRSGGLLRPAGIAPLHLRAIDIGTEEQFISSMLQKLNSTAAPGDACPPKRTLWLQFVPPGLAPHTDLPDASSDEDESVSPAPQGPAPAMDRLAPSRYSKWAARISNTAQSIRILAAALEQVPLATPPFRAAALEAVSGICAIVFTKLSCAGSMPPDDRDEIVACIWQCVCFLGTITGVEESGLVAMPPATSPDIVEACRICQTCLALLSLHQCWLMTPRDQPLDPRLVGMARHLLSRLCGPKQLEAVQTEPSPQTSRRSFLAAHLDDLLEGAPVPQSEPTSPIARRVLEGIIMPLASAGASPVLLGDIARLAASDLKKRKTARAILRLTLVRFDAMWSRHHECSTWQHGWSQLQAAQSPRSAGPGSADEARLPLEALLSELEQHRAHKAPAQPRAVDVVEDELCALPRAMRGRQRRRRQPVPI